MRTMSAIRVLRRFAVKIPSVFETIQDVMEQPVKVSGDKVVRFMDVAQIRRSYKDPNSIARINGQQAVSLEVKKRAGENIMNMHNKDVH